MKEPLFCVECEGKFNKLETPFSQSWRAPDRFPASLKGLLAVRVDGIDYDNTRKLLLSILWRAHVASNPAQCCHTPDRMPRRCIRDLFSEGQV